MTYSDIVTNHNQQCPGDLTQQAQRARVGAGELPARAQALQGDPGILQMRASQAGKD